MADQSSTRHANRLGGLGWDAPSLSLVALRVLQAALEPLARLIANSCAELVKAVHSLRAMKDVIPSCVEINRLENEADDLARDAIARLFEGGHTPIDVIKWKEIYETMETATDRCEDVANIVEGIHLKNA